MENVAIGSAGIPDKSNVSVRSYGGMLVRCYALGYNSSYFALGTNETRSKLHMNGPARGMIVHCSLTRRKRNKVAYNDRATKIVGGLCMRSYMFSKAHANVHFGAQHGHKKNDSGACCRELHVVGMKGTFA